MNWWFDNTLVTEMDVREVDMSVLDAGERDRGSRLCRAAAHLRSAELEAMRQIDADAVLGASHRVADRLADRLDDARHAETTAPGGDIDLVFDGLEPRRQLGRRHRRKHPPTGRH